MVWWIICASFWTNSDEGGPRPRVGAEPPPGGAVGGCPACRRAERMIPPATRARADALLARFLDAGAARVDPPILLPAGPLLDLYGEDIRARAFTTTDPLRGEAMLRPDFTVPVAQAHDPALGPAAYAYAGEVFRRQEDDESRPREYLQVGLERLGGTDRAAEDAAVFAAFHDVLAPDGPTARVGDLGLLLAAVDALHTTARRRAALRRHVWRPARFRRLLDRFTHPAPRPAAPDADAPLVGLRTADEIAARHAALAEEARTPPLDPGQAATLEALIDMDLPLPEGLDRVDALAAAMPDLAPAAAALRARARAVAARGVDLAALRFAPTTRRSAMEYYDGFTFTFAMDGETVATGGRYDALTAALGHPVPAVGGVVRPGLLGDAP